MEDDKRLIRVEDKIDKLGDRLGAIDSTLASQHESLKQHMYRTQLLEEAVKPMIPVITIIKFCAKAAVVLLTSEVLYAIIKKVIE